jgi:hypothetical protein
MLRPCMHRCILCTVGRCGTADQQQHLCQLLRVTMRVLHVRRVRCPLAGPAQAHWHYCMQSSLVAPFVICSTTGPAAASSAGPGKALLNTSVCELLFSVCSRQLHWALQLLLADRPAEVLLQWCLYSSGYGNRCTCWILSSHQVVKASHVMRSIM